MPTYEYKCAKCGVFEKFQSIKADPLETCPTCGEPVSRLVGRNVSIMFKGSGFYCTDYSSKGSQKKVEKTQKESKSTSTS